MSAIYRLQFWRRERDRLRRELASDPTDARKLNGVLKDDLEQAEAYIRFYEDAAAHKEKQARQPGDPEHP